MSSVLEVNVTHKCLFNTLFISNLHKLKLFLNASTHDDKIQYNDIPT